MRIAMSLRLAVTIATLGGSGIDSFGQLVVVPDEQPQVVLAGAPQTIRLIVRNPGDKPLDAVVSTRLFQATSVSAVPLGPAQPWKTLQVLPGQTIIETAVLTLPEVRTMTRFLVQWGDLGRTPVLVCPGDLLKELLKLAGEYPPGVFDPDDHLKPVLKLARVKYTDFETEPGDCRLALVWTKAGSLPDSVATRAKKGMGVVWIRPHKSPAAYAVHYEDGIVVIVPQAGMTALADSPLAQLNLIRFAELALTSDALRLPSDTQP
jgi:hypothetical protein